MSLSSCRGQAYDGAANMAGHLNGVAAKILAEEPKAIFVHCLAHSVNLCLQECKRQSKVIRDGYHLSMKSAILLDHLQNIYHSSSA